MAKSVSHSFELISFYFKFWEQIFIYFLSPEGPSYHAVENHQCTLVHVNHMIIVQWLARIVLSTIMTPPMSGPCYDSHIKPDRCKSLLFENHVRQQPAHLKHQF